MLFNSFFKNRLRYGCGRMMRSQLMIAALVVACCAINVLAQDPTKVAPDAYKLQFENDWVRILRVHYAPHSRVPMHDHSAWPAAYVYLNDAGPVTFKHEGWEDPDLTRPPVKARSFRLSPTRFSGERHEVQNSGNTASDFLREEFKTMQQGSG